MIGTQAKRTKVTTYVKVAVEGVFGTNKPSNAFVSYSPNTPTGSTPQKNTYGYNAWTWGVQNYNSTPGTVDYIITATLNGTAADGTPVNLIDSAKTPTLAIPQGQ